MSSRRRHLAKAVSYRVFGTVGTAAAAYVVTGNIEIGATIGVLDSVMKIGVYYLHERAWHRIAWGESRRDGAATPPSACR